MPPEADPLGAVADELYGLPAADFTAARNAAAKTAKSEGDRDLAARIAALPKPSTAAWVVNQLVRRHPDDVDALLELGADMRAAERARDADRIRSLSRERNLRVPALARQARAVADEAGQAVSDAVETEIENTLTAALATEDFGAAVRSGRLTKALVWAGFGEMPELGTLVAVPSRPAAGAKATAKDTAGQTGDDTAERERLAAEEAAREAAEQRARDLAEAEEAAAAADERVAELTAAVEDLTRQLQWAKERLTEAKREAKGAAKRVAELRG
jgi:DNA repair exonuclease SbcCD ATPase subunit